MIARYASSTFFSAITFSYLIAFSYQLTSYIIYVSVYQLQFCTIIPAALGGRLTKSWLLTLGELFILLAAAPGGRFTYQLHQHTRRGNIRTYTETYTEKGHIYRKETYMERRLIWREDLH